METLGSALVQAREFSYSNSNSNDDERGHIVRALKIIIHLQDYSLACESMGAGVAPLACVVFKYRLVELKDTLSLRTMWPRPQNVRLYLGLSV